MSRNIAKGCVVAVLALQLLYRILIVGKPRNAVTPAEAANGTLIDGLLIATILLM